MNEYELLDWDTDFYRMFDNIYASGILFSGQYLYVVADLSSLKCPICDHRKKINFPKNFLKDVETNIFEDKDRKIAVWGGASKGVIFTLLKSRIGQNINAIN